MRQAGGREEGSWPGHRCLPRTSQHTHELGISTGFTRIIGEPGVKVEDSHEANNTKLRVVPGATSTGP